MAQTPSLLVSMDPHLFTDYVVSRQVQASPGASGKRPARITATMASSSDGGLDVEVCFG